MVIKYHKLDEFEIDTDFDVGINFYHGTNKEFEIGDKLLPPSQTGNLRELYRDRRELMDSVYVTSSRHSAHKYAKKCQNQNTQSKGFVYRVEPCQESLVNVHNTEFICDFAVIIEIVETLHKIQN